MERTNWQLIVSASDLVGHLACGHLTVLDGRVSTGGLAKPERDDPELAVLLGEIAATSEWLPAPDGRWVLPERLSLDALPSDFKRDEALAKALGMSLPAVEEAARELDVSPDLLRHLRDPDVRDALEKIVTGRSAEAAGGPSDEEGEDPDDESEAPPEIAYAVALAEAFDRPATRVRTSADGSGGGRISNPDLRRQRTREAIAEDKAAEPQYQDRFRPVPRKVWEAKDSATRQFVEEQYSGRVVRDPATCA